MERTNIKLLLNLIYYYGDKLIMKKTFLFILLLIFCGYNISKISAEEKKTFIFACSPEWASLAKEIVGDDTANIYSATGAKEDAHYVSARPSLLAKMRTSDFVFCTGADLEIGWLPLLLRSAASSKIQRGEKSYFEAVSSLNNLLEVPNSLDRIQGDIHAQGNPHIHLNPYNILKVALSFTHRMQTLYPQHHNLYQERYTSFKNKLQRNISKWEAMASPLKGLKFIEYHTHYSYLAQWIKLKKVASIEKKPGIPPTPNHLTQLVETVKRHKVIIITNPQISNKYFKWLNKKTNAPICDIPFQVGATPTAQDIFKLFDETIIKLLECNKNLKQ